MNLVEATCDYKTGKVIISGNFDQESTLVNLPKDDEDYDEFVSLYLHRYDIQESMEYLQLVSTDKALKINKALFLSALSTMIKCFQNSESRKPLSTEELKNHSPEIYDEFSKYKAWRNKHFFHDENSMTKCTAILFVAPEDSPSVLGGAPTVIWNSISIPFWEESAKLYGVLEEVYNLIVNKIDDVENRIIKRYSKKDRSDLLKYGPAEIDASSLVAPDKKR